MDNHRFSVQVCPFCMENHAYIDWDTCDACGSPVCLTCGSNNHEGYAWVCPECAEPDEE